MAHSLTAVFDQITQHQADLRSLGVVKLQLFGSTARNEATPVSDLDFLVELRENTFRNYMDTKLYLEDLFGCDVDLVIQDSIKPTLRENILQEAVHVPCF